MTMVIAAATARAQTVANGPYYAPPSWDQTLPVATRFIILSNFADAAVLDRETGLVWEKSPSNATNSRAGSVINCQLAATGGRQGWRLPRVDELMSLADPTNNTNGVPHIPAGHPFLNITGAFYAADHSPAGLTQQATVVFFDSSLFGAFLNQVAFGDLHRRWCVRGAGWVEIR